jgi:hypothetical protein
LYKAEQLPVRVRLYAASKAYDFESLGGKSIEQIRDEVRQELQGDPEESRRETQAMLDTFVMSAIKETRARINGQARGAGAPAWIVALVKQVLAEAQATPISELVPPPPAPPVVRKRESPGIDAETAHMAEKPEPAADHPPSAAGQSPAAADDADPEVATMVPTRRPGGGIRWVPL